MDFDDDGGAGGVDFDFGGDVGFGGGGGGGGAADWLTSALEDKDDGEPKEKIVDIFKYEATGLEKTRIFPKLLRVGAAFELGVSLQLEMMCARIRIMEFTKRAFRSARLLMDCKNGVSVHATVSPNGKVVILGTRSEKDAVYAAKKICKLFRAVGVSHATIRNFRVTNALAISDLKAPVRLMDMHKAYPQWTTYAPDIFPAARVRMHTPRCVASVFVNGKIIITGFNEAASLPKIISKLFPIIKNFIGPSGSDPQQMLRKYFGDCLGPVREIAGYTEEYESDDDAKKDAAWEQRTKRFESEFSRKLQQRAMDVNAKVKAENAARGGARAGAEAAGDDPYAESTFGGMSMDGLLGTGLDDPFSADPAALDDGGAGGGLLDGDEALPPMDIDGSDPWAT